MLVTVRLEHKLAIIAGSVVAPGFAQALAGRRRAALVWLALGLVPMALAWCSIWITLAALAMRVAAGIGAYRELRRFPATPSWWWTRLSGTAFAVGIASFVLLQLGVEAFRIPSSSMYPTLVIGDHIFVDTLSPHWRAPERGEIIVFKYPCDRTRDYIKRVIAIGGDTVEVRCNVVYVNGQAIPSALVDDSGTYKDYDDMDNRWFERPTSRYRESHGGHTYEVFHDAERPQRDRAAATAAIGDNRDFPTRERMFAPSCRQSDFYPAEQRILQLAGTLVVTKPEARACEPQAHFVVPAGGLFVMGDNRNNANDSRYWGVVSIEDVVGRAMGIWMTKAPGDDGSLGRIGTIE